MPTPANDKAIIKKQKGGRGYDCASPPVLLYLAISLLIEPSANLDGAVEPAPNSSPTTSPSPKAAT
jgi:hypothetical protein